jgi:hypothetical protein
MSHPVTVELSDAAYSLLELRAKAAAQSPEEVAAAALEQHLGATNGANASQLSALESEKKAARERFERHFGAVDLGYATGVDNVEIDADLARDYADSHEDG